MTIYILGVLTVLLPLFLIAWLSFGKVQSKAEWLLRFLFVGSIVLICFKIGTWSITSYYLKFAVAALFVSASLFSFFRIHAKSWFLPGYQWSSIGLTAIFALIGVSMSILTLLGGIYSDKTVSLKFPFAQGKYYVIQGGSNVMTNPFHSMAPSGKYAIDIVKLNNYGNRATRVIPVKLDQYHIFGEVVHSPCNGLVISAASDLADNSPTKVDRENTAGNHIIIDCHNSHVILAHLKQNSIRVTKGTSVREGQPIGEVGNSGTQMNPIFTYRLTRRKVVRSL
jgi:hypothetical protein